MIWQENEKQDTRIQRKARIRGPTALRGEGAETESKPALLYFIIILSVMNETLTHVAFRAKEQNDH